MTRTELLTQGLAPGAVDSAQLVLSELVGNSVRACGDHVPLVVEVCVTSYGIALNVHDPDPGVLPRPGGGSGWSICSRRGGMCGARRSGSRCCRVPAEEP
ncbi:hypothetical protein ACI2L1_09285 [Streptomyces sp. NPDC019531]|uniref:hypothetical protein n=1 Tax=Streptomyces sp. NPDC019531 TaxID=3365062 RepID=UPI00384ACEF8